MVVGVMELTLALYDNDSLKAKRSVVKRLVHRCRGRFNVAVAEVEQQDAPDRAILGFVAVGSDKRYLEGLLQQVEQFVDKQGLAELLDAPKEFTHY